MRTATISSGLEFRLRSLACERFSRPATRLERRPENPILDQVLADPSALLIFALIGFAAQLVDGALGMAFGQISSTILISIGVPPAVASAGVQTAETLTTGDSSISHVAHRNVDWRLFFRIVTPGVIGGVLGAYVLTQINASTARPLVLGYPASPTARSSRNGRPTTT